MSPKRLPPLPAPWTTSPCLPSGAASGHLALVSNLSASAVAAEQQDRDSFIACARVLDPGGEVAAGSSRCRVLVVDDNEDAAASLALVLTLTGHAVRTAADGRAALEAVQEFHPDAVVLDIGLPGLDGFEVARRLRQDPDLGPRLVLVALTGYAGDEWRRRCLEAGFDSHLVKPSDPAEVRRAIRASRVG